MNIKQEDRDALATAISSGAMSVSYEGKSVTYRSLEEMRQILSIMDAELMGRKPRRRISPRSFKNL